MSQDILHLYLNNLLGYRYLISFIALFILFFLNNLIYLHYFLNFNSGHLFIDLELKEEQVVQMDFIMQIKKTNLLN